MNWIGRSACLAALAMALMTTDALYAQPGGFGGPPPFGPPPGEMVRTTPVLSALDADEDGEITLQEIDNGADRLKQLDKNGDAKLSGNEITPTLGPPGGRDGNDRAGGNEPRFGGPPPGMLEMILPLMPWMIAIDKDKNDSISMTEIDNAAAPLKRLDRNGDGKLTEDELRPDMGRLFGRGGRRGRGGFGGGFGGGEGPSEKLSPEQLDPADGVASVPDHAAFQALSYKGDEVMIDSFLAGLEFVKFTIDEPESKHPALYFINTVRHRAHMMFARAAGLPRGGREQMKGVLVYRPRLTSPSGHQGLFTFEFEPFDSYSIEMVEIAQNALFDKMPILKGNLGYYPRGRAMSRYEEERELWDASNIKVYREEELTNSDLAYLPLNPTESFGRLRLMKDDDRPSPRDVVIYEALPNELPRVAGIITAVRQTPLSHVNLRAVQDKVPNAFIKNAATDNSIEPLIGKHVYYKVTADGYELREATSEEVDAHFADLRPSQPQSPPRDLSVTEIRPLDEISFEDANSVGVKAANVATMRTFEFPEYTVPNGYAVPFYYYDEFMKHNNFYDHVDTLLANPEFQRDRDLQEKELKKLRKLIKKGEMPSWMMKALDNAHKTFPAGTSIRCRSSTNNEDLPGFSGAGLYDSCTQHPDEGHLSKSIKQVFASLWNFRAFEEREFYRIDHKAAAMGVLMHPNYKGETVNGVAVTDDILYETLGNYYVNSQVGEDLVTNPEEQSAPEELLLGWYKDDGFRVMRASNRADQDTLLLSDRQLDELRNRLARIHGRFRRLYGKSEDDRFAMEIEFKITKEGHLAIKQARPWVYAEEPESNN